MQTKILFSYEDNNGLRLADTLVFNTIEDARCYLKDNSYKGEGLLYSKVFEKWSITAKLVQNL